MKEGYIIRDQEKIHFITAMVVDWIDVFTNKNDEDTLDSTSNTGDDTNFDSNTNNRTNEITDNNSNTTNTGNTNTDSSSGSDTSNTGINDSSPSNNSSNTEDTEVVIVHNNKSYKNGDVIEVEYDREKPHFAFLLKNYPKDATFNWQVLKGGTDNTSAFATNETMHDNLGVDMKQIHILDIVANYNNEKLQVTIKRIVREFKLEEFYALHGSKRLAKSGETLYLVNPPSVSKHIKTVKYGLSIDIKINPTLIPPNSIQWSYNGENQYFSTAKTNITRSLEESDNIITTSVTAGSPNLLEKSVDVQWVDENLEVISYANKINKLMEVFGVVNEVSDKISTVAPCGITFAKDLNRSIKFQWSDYNEEDKSSRHAHKVDKFEFIASVDNLVKLKCGKKLAISVFGYGLDLGEIYAQLAAGVDASIINSDYYLYEDNSYIKNDTYGNGGLKVTGELGLTVGGGLKDDNGSLIVGLVGGGKVSITGGGRLEYPFDGDKQKLGIVFYINPLTYAFTAEAKLGSYLSKQFEYKGTLIDIRKRKKRIINLD